MSNVRGDAVEREISPDLGSACHSVGRIIGIPRHIFIAGFLWRAIEESTPLGRVLSPTDGMLPDPANYFIV